MKKLIFIFFVLLFAVDIISGDKFETIKALRNCVVAIYKDPIGEGREKDLQFHGTGFLVWDYDDESQKILITNRHIFEGKDLLWIGVTHISGKALLFSELILEKNGKKIWTGYPDSTIDIALIPISIECTVEKDGEKRLMKFGTLSIAPGSYFAKENEVQIGEEVVFVGFPLGINEPRENNPMVRRGMVSWFGMSKFPWKDGIKPPQKPIFYIDGTSLGGNSGSPVYSLDRGKVIGVVQGHISFPREIDTLSVKLGDIVDTIEKKRVTKPVVRENTDLIQVIPIWYLCDIINCVGPTREE